MKLTIAFALLLCAFAATAQPGNILIKAAPHATHIARITKDTIIVATGRTYRFTVDTPEDQGLISTGITADELAQQLVPAKNDFQQYRVTDAIGNFKTKEKLISGDRLLVTYDHIGLKKYYISVKPMALSGKLWLERDTIPVNTTTSLTLYFTAGQRSPDATVVIYLPAGIQPTMGNTSVNVIGRGEVLLKDLATQSIGRTGTKYSYSRVGEVSIKKIATGSLITFKHLDLRPANGPDLTIVIKNVRLQNHGKYPLKAVYTTSVPDVLTSAGTASEAATLTATRTIAGMERMVDMSTLYDVKKFGATGDSSQDCTEQINAAIHHLHTIGGGTLLFSKGIYSVRTIHLKSNVHLFINKDAVIKALKGADAPEATWFSDKKYRSGLSPTDTGPYDDPENYLTKQDVGHHYFRNTMFFGERINNVKIIGNGRITGNGNLVTGDRVMNNAPDNRADKMFTFKLCTNIEIGGIARKEDLWYDSARDEPYYIGSDSSTGNMLNIDRGGHFVLLATGTDNINVHDTYFGKHSGSNARDIYDFMGCNNVTVTNIYSKVSSDDIVKLGSDCSLGFTRPAGNYKIRNVIGDTNCNLFQIGSETADDIKNVCVDNIYVLGANKAGFSISTNDGGHISDIHLNCGHTGKLHSRSKMFRTFTPFFISISNRGRVIGAAVGKYSFDENGTKRNELLVKNINIGKVENITINNIDVYEVYAGSSYSGNRWKPYDGSQRRASPIIAGYALPASTAVEGGLDFKLPDGRHTGYITNIVFIDVHILVKGGNPASDTTQRPPELGVGQYNASNLKVQPSYGLWARHVKDLTVKNSSFRYEKPDGRHAIFLDDVINARTDYVR